MLKQPQVGDSYMDSGLWLETLQEMRPTESIKKSDPNNMSPQSNITCIGSTKDLRSDFDQIEG